MNNFSTEAISLKYTYIYRIIRQCNFDLILKQNFDEFL